MLDADATKNGTGVYTCQTCSALFTCLEYFQQHRKDHAQAEGVKLFTCLHCTYVTDNTFYFNWHAMTHASQQPHKCEVCSPEDFAPEGTTNGWSTYGDGDSGAFGSDGASYKPGRISETSVSFGKRSIATQSSEDHIFQSSPSYQAHSLTNNMSPSIRNRENIYNNLETIDARHLMDSNDNDEQQQAAADDDDDDATQNEEDEDDADDDDDEDDNDTEEDEPLEEDMCQSQQQLPTPQQEQPFQECDNQNVSSVGTGGGDGGYFEQQEDNNEQQPQEYGQQYMGYQQEQQQQPMQNGGDEDEEDDDEDEDDGTIEDEEAQGMIQQEETTGQEFQNQGMEQYQEDEDDDEEEDDEDDDDDGHDYEAPMEDGDDGEVMEEQGDMNRKLSSDVYDFNSDDDGLGEDEEVLSEHSQQVQMQQQQQQQQPNNVPQSQAQQVTLQPQSQLAPIPSQPQQVPGQPQQGTPQLVPAQTLPPELRTSIGMNQHHHHPNQHIALQPTFVHHTTTHPHPHPHQHHQTGLPTLAPAHPHPHAHPAQGQPQSMGAPGTTTFQLQPPPPHMTNHHPHPATAHHYITIPSGAGFAPAQPGPGNAFQLDAAAFGPPGTIRLVQIPAPFNPQQAVPQHQVGPPGGLQGAPPHQTMTQLQPAPQMTSQQQQSAQSTLNGGGAPSGAAPAAPPPRKRSKKKAAGSNGNGDGSDGLVVSTPVQPPFVPTKGKGKGNRKPRINFISVINGITVGADGIRRKFHCSHCGNGKSFKTKSHLQRHMLTHTGEKPYQCNECGSKFNQSSSLRNHIIAIHTKKFPHTCHTCGKGFLMPAVLQKHLQQTGHTAGVGGGFGNGSTGSPSTSHGVSEDANSKDGLGDELKMMEGDTAKMGGVPAGTGELMYVYSASS